VRRQRLEAIDRAVETWRWLWGSQLDFDERWVRARVTHAHDRAYRPEGVARNMLAFAGAPGLWSAQKAIRCPTLVVQGNLDPCFPVQHAESAADAIPGARLDIFDGMGHAMHPRALRPSRRRGAHLGRPMTSDAKTVALNRIAGWHHRRGEEITMPANLLELYMRTIKAFNENDLDAAQQIVSSDVVYTFHGDHPAAGEYRGLDGFREVLARAKELTGGTASLEPLAVVTNDEDALTVWGIFRGERNGVSFQTHHAYYYRFEDGRLVEGHTIPADQKAANAFWSS